MSFICPEKHRAVAKAFAEGKQIQIRNAFNDAAWADMDSAPNWANSREYRVKPERKWRWVYADRDRNVKVTAGFWTEEEIDARCKKRGSILIEKIDKLYKDE